MPLGLAENNMVVVTCNNAQSSESPNPNRFANQAISAFIRYGGRSIYDLQYLSMPYAFHGREHVDVHTRDSTKLDAM